MYYDDGEKEHNFTVHPFMEAPANVQQFAAVAECTIISLYQCSYQVNIINYRGQLKTYIGIVAV